MTEDYMSFLACGKYINIGYSVFSGQDKNVFQLIWWFVFFFYLYFFKGNVNVWAKVYTAQNVSCKNQSVMINRTFFVIKFNIRTKMCWKVDVMFVNAVLQSANTAMQTAWGKKEQNVLFLNNLLNHKYSRQTDLN